MRIILKANKGAVTQSGRVGGWQSLCLGFESRLLHMEFKEFIEQLALEAGKIIGDNLDKHKEIVTLKGEYDFTTHVDHEVEQFVRNKIEEKYPGHSIMGEELGESQSTSEYKWFIDPIDGTKNYAHNLAGFSVSIGLAKNGEVIAGAVCDPLRKELFSAAKGGGAFLNGNKIECSSRKEFMKCIKILSDEKVLEKFKLGARKTSEKFDVNKIVTKYETLYQNMI